MEELSETLFLKQICEISASSWSCYENNHENKIKIAQYICECVSTECKYLKLKNISKIDGS